MLSLQCLTLLTMLLLPHHSSPSNNLIINIYVKVILHFTAASESLTGIHCTAKISAYWRINIIPIYEKNRCAQDIYVVWSSVIWAHTTAPWFSDLLLFTYALCSRHFCHSIPQWLQYDKQPLCGGDRPAQCVSVMPLESLVEYIISDCTICTSGGHVLASVIRRSRAWGTASFITHGLIQVGPWLHWRAHSSSANHLCVWWVVKHHIDTQQCV